LYNYYTYKISYCISAKEKRSWDKDKSLFLITELTFRNNLSHLCNNGSNILMVNSIAIASTLVEWIKTKVSMRGTQPSLSENTILNSRTKVHCLQWISATIKVSTNFSAISHALNILWLNGAYPHENVLLLTSTIPIHVAIRVSYLNN